MIKFSAKIQRFEKHGEKTGWSYIVISRKHAETLNPADRKSFRVKGQLDNFKIEKTSLLCFGEGKFIMAINAAMRKGTGKKEGDTLKVQIELDKRQITPSSDFMKCLKDDHKAYVFFKALPRGHQNYFSKWIDSAKTIGTKTRRITMAVIALGSGQGYGEMIRANKSTVDQ